MFVDPFEHNIICNYIPNLGEDGLRLPVRSPVSDSGLARCLVLSLLGPGDEAGLCLT